MCRILGDTKRYGDGTVRWRLLFLHRLPNPLGEKISVLGVASWQQDDELFAAEAAAYIVGSHATLNDVGQTF
ncbi:hypothetical protein D3C84_1097880 [compost metagenome]